MKCQKFRGLIPDFIEGQLNPEVYKRLLEHLQACKDCAKEKGLYEESWQLIGQWKDIEPEPGFKTRFWNRLVSQTETAKIPKIDVFRLLQHWPVALATATIIIMAVGFILPNYFQSRRTEILVSKINEEEMVLVENIDLLENLEVIEDIDFLENMELIENLDKFELNKA